MTKWLNSPAVGGPVILGDGGMATALQDAGLPLGEPPERWNLEHPEKVRRVHAAHAEAGAQWVATNTFGGNRVRMQATAWAGRAREIQDTAVRAARAGAPGLPVLGSIGPTGSLDPGEWATAYREQAEALAEARADGFLVETIIRLDEGTAAVLAAAATGAGPVWAAFTPGPDGRLLDGTAPEAAAAALVRAGACVVGVNCGAGPETLLEPARRLVRASVAPVLAAPNAGLPRLEGERAHYAVSPDAFARSAIQFQDAGVRCFAGCCGVSPAHLRVAALALSTARQGEHRP